ncbi:DUF58 domain-containing protein [Calidifontibacter terrae]
MSTEVRGSWVPGPTFLAGTLAAIGFAALAVLTGRADLLVLAMPLIVVATWSYAQRPSGKPSAMTQIANRTPAEQESVRWSADLSDAAGAEQWHVVVEDTPGVVWDSDRRTATSLPSSGDDTIDLTFALRRWGPAEVGSAEAVATSPWAAYVWGPAHLPGSDLRGLPRKEPFTGRAPIPHPLGLVGPNRSARFGDGAEFADIRPFRPGDKLRTIHWPVTTRTGELHVRTSYAEQDAEVVLVLDGSIDIGGLGDTDSSLDLGLRACASLSAYFLGRGDRVGLDVIGTGAVRHVPVSLGSRQQHRVLDTLSRVRVGRFTDSRPELVRLRVSPGATVFLVSSLLTALGAAIAADLARRGLQVIVIDCLPTDLTRPDDDIWDQLALRVRTLERQAEIDGLALHGVPITPWRGPGSLDAALQVLSRRPPARVRAR